MLISSSKPSGLSFINLIMHQGQRFDAFRTAFRFFVPAVLLSI
jgi:hypothetical protein